MSRKWAKCGDKVTSALQGAPPFSGLGQCLHMGSVSDGHLLFPGDKRFECAQCQKRFMRSDHLTKHYKTHLVTKNL